MAVVILILAFLGATIAQREQSLNVINSLRQVQPAYRDLQNFVINAVSSAKLNSSDVIFNFYEEVASSKEVFLRSAIGLESTTLQHINGQDVNVDGSCLGFLRSSIDVNINLAGVSFSNCISVVDRRLGEEIKQMYNELQVNETDFIDISIYDVFQGQNIFVNPQQIITLLEAKLEALQQAPTGLVSELAAQVNNFRGRLAVIRGNYQQCLTLNDQLLQTAVNTILIQLQQICLGTLLPNPTTEVVPSTEPTDPPAATGSENIEPNEQPTDSNVDVPSQPPSVEPTDVIYNYVNNRE